MAQKLLTSLDFNRLELLNIRFQQLATDPGSPLEGLAYWNTTTHQFKLYDGTSWIGLGSGSGSVTNVNVASANGFAGTVANASTTPTITISTTVTGLLKGNGTAISAASASDVPTPLTTKGDLFAFSTSATRFTVSGTNGRVLVENSGASFGMQWTGLDHTYISDFDTQVRTSRLDQMAAPTASVSLGSQKITNLLDPTSAQDAATKNYVDAMAQGIDFKASVRVIATTQASLTSAYANGQSVDGVTLVTGDRILLGGQTTASDNGIYTVNASGAPTRATDADASGEISKGALVYVEAGTAHAGQLWVCSATGATPWVPGTSTSTWTQFAGAADITATSPIIKTGNAIGINLGNGLTSSGGNAIVDTTVVVRKFAATIGDGTSTSIAVTHSLGTQDVTVSVRDATTNAFVMCDITANSASQVTLGFAVAPASNAYRVVVHG